jgi:hypothetical protein
MTIQLLVLRSRSTCSSPSGTDLEGTSVSVSTRSGDSSTSVFGPPSPAVRDRVKVCSFSAVVRVADSERYDVQIGASTVTFASKDLRASNWIAVIPEERLDQQAA